MLVQTDFDAAVEPVEFCMEKTGGITKYEKVVYGERLVQKACCCFGDLQGWHISYIATVETKALYTVSTDNELSAVKLMWYQYCVIKDILYPYILSTKCC